MKNLDNIEELFREGLSGLEADPGAGVWEAIQQGLPAPQAAAASTSAGVASKISTFKLIAGVAIVSVGVGLTAGYFYSENKNEKAVQKEESKNENATNPAEEKSLITENKSKDEVAAVNEVKESDLQQNDVIVKDEKKNKTIIVSVKENPHYNPKKSSVDRWITKNNDYLVTNSGGNSTTEKIEENNSGNNNPVIVSVQEVDNSKPIASIKRTVSGGPAPLTVTFSNSTEEKAYEWSFNGYSEKIKDPTVTHIFEVPGTYSISLTVKDDKGNKSTDQIEITVGEPVITETANLSKVETYGVNVFSPNNDNVNDHFFFESENLTYFYIQVVDKNGKVFYESNDPDFNWDGTMKNGEMIPEGTYFYYYKAEGKDKATYSDFKPLDIKY